METKIEDFGINIDCERSAAVTVKENYYIVIEFSKDKKGNPTDLAKNPKLLVKALSEIKARYPDYEPKCLLYQASDWVMYHFKRIL